jgi:hypothetical protein
MLKYAGTNHTLLLHSDPHNLHMAYIICFPLVYRHVPFAGYLGLVTSFVGNGARGIANGNSGYASFYNPEGITYDGKDLFVMDNMSVVRRVTPSGKLWVSVLPTPAQARAHDAYAYSLADQTCTDLLLM